MQPTLLMIFLLYAAIIDERATDQLVELTAQNSASTTLVGDIQLGQVLAGSTVSVKFKVKNSSNNEIEFASVSPSCKCTDISLPSAKIAAGETLGQEANIRVKIPEVRGSNVTIGGVLVKTSTGSQSAILRVKADIRRALFIPTQVTTFTLDSTEIFETALNVDVDPEIELSHVKITCANQSVSLSIVRSQTGEWPCKLKLSGNRSHLLESPNLAVEISLPTASIRDVVRFQFFDGMLVRTIPAEPKIVDGKINFILFRKNGVNPSKLSFKNSEGLEMQAVCRVRTKSLLDVTIEGLADDKCVLQIGNGEFEFSLTALKENEDD